LALARALGIYKSARYARRTKRTRFQLKQPLKSTGSP